MNKISKPGLRSRQWFNDPSSPDMTALYIERYLNYGLTREELQSGRPIIGIAQTGSDLTPCNRHHVDLAVRIKEGVRDGGGIPMEFPMHPIQESARRPTAALDRNLAFLGLVEILRGYPLDAVVLTTGCDKTTPAGLMAVAATDTPAIVFSGGPMLNGWDHGKRVGSGTIIWDARRKLATGEIDQERFMELACASAPSIGHCNTMGTALSMNVLAEALGMSLPGCASIPAPYRERAQMAYATGKRAVEIAHGGIRPSMILNAKSFRNAIRVASAIGASSNCPPHLIAIARHAGADLSLNDWQDTGFAVPLIVNCQPTGTYLGEEFHRAGGARAVMGELLAAGVLEGDALTIAGGTLAAAVEAFRSEDQDVIHRVDQPLQPNAGFTVLSGNIFDAAVLKTSAISPAFRARYLQTPGRENSFQARVVVFDGPEDYHRRIDDPALGIDEDCVLVIRFCGPLGFPGGPEVVNMQPPAHLLRAGIAILPTMGDGRQSGTSASPSILNVSPEAAIGGGLALLRNGDRLNIDLNQRRVDLLLSEDALQERRKTLDAEIQQALPQSATPWEELFRRYTGQLSRGACLDFAIEYQKINTAGIPRHNH